MNYPAFLKEKIVEKGWGNETIIVNNDFYCGKILRFNKGSKFSMHFHMKKHETWYVLEGKFIFRWINTQSADVFENNVTVGSIIDIKQGLPHQLMALENGTILEISTRHHDDDSYRVYKGDSQDDSKV